MAENPLRQFIYSNKTIRRLNSWQQIFKNNHTHSIVKVWEQTNKILEIMEQSIELELIISKID